jgi:rod shape-determining protein MreC
MSVQVAPRTRVLGSCLALLFVSMGLTSYSGKNPWIVQKLAAVASLPLQPFQLIVSSSENGISSLWHSYFNLVGVTEENGALKKRLQSLEAEYSNLIESKYENDRLRGLLQVRQDHALEGKVGRVIAHDPTKWAHTATLDVGYGDGIEVGMAVLDGKGVVGQIVSVSSLSSRVLLLTDPNSGVDAIAQEGRVRGVAEGQGKKQLRWQYVLNDTHLPIGARVITSGKDGIFPKGLLVGVVSEVVRVRGALFQKVLINPAVNYAGLETVLVVTSKTKEPADEGAKEDSSALKTADDSKLTLENTPKVSKRHQ